MVETIDSTGLHCQAFSPSPAASSCGFAVLQDPLFNTCTQGCSEGPVSYCGGGAHLERFLAYSVLQRVGSIFESSVFVHKHLLIE